MEERSRFDCKHFDYEEGYDDVGMISWCMKGHDMDDCVCEDFEKED